MDESKKSAEHTWKLFVNGQDSFFEKLYLAYYKSLCDFGFRLCTDKELVKDCVQDVFIKIWTNRKELQQINSIKSYLFTALRNSIISFYSSPKSRVDRLSDGILPIFILEYSPEEILIGKEIDTENHRKVVKALNNLTARQKECIYLRYYAGLEYEEIAKILGISVKACYKLIGRALLILRNWSVKENSSGGKPMYLWFL